MIEAQEIIKDTGCYINPEGFHTGEQVHSGYDQEYRHVQKVKMSIAINVIENNEKKAGLGVVSAIISAGWIFRSKVSHYSGQTEPPRIYVSKALFSATCN